MKRTILVDLDGVLVDLLPTWLRVYGEASGDWVHPDDVTEYEFEQFVEEPDVFFACLGGALRESMPTVGSSAFNDLLEDDNLDVYVVTYAHAAAPDAHQAKLAWLERFFPLFDRNRVIFTKHKHLVRGDVLIEDSPENCAEWSRLNPAGLAVIVAQPYNQGHNPGCRIETFGEVPAMLQNFFPEEAI